MGARIDDYTLIVDHRICTMFIAGNGYRHDRFRDGLTHYGLLADGHRSRRGLLLYIGYRFLWRWADSGSDNGASYAADGCSTGLPAMTAPPAAPLTAPFCASAATLHPSRTASAAVQARIILRISLLLFAYQRQT